MGILKLFSYLYDKTIRWSSHQHAPYYLAGVSFAESSFFPIPPDVMLISMGLAAPKRSWNYAIIATIFSVIGGLFGYIIGHYFILFVEPYLLTSSYAAMYEKINGWFDLYGVWILIVAGFTPIPYKLFTIAAGAMSVPLFPFIVGSVVGRGLRFFLVSGILYYSGAHLETRLRHFIDYIGWSFLILLAIIIVLFKWIL